MIMHVVLYAYVMVSWVQELWVLQHQEPHELTHLSLNSTRHATRKRSHLEVPPLRPGPMDNIFNQSTRSNQTVVLFVGIDKVSIRCEKMRPRPCLVSIHCKIKTREILDDKRAAHTAGLMGIKQQSTPTRTEKTDKRAKTATPMQEQRQNQIEASRTGLG
jgi:hypothetical protein